MNARPDFLRPILRDGGLSAISSRSYADSHFSVAASLFRVGCRSRERIIEHFVDGGCLAPDVHACPTIHPFSLSRSRRRFWRSHLSFVCLSCLEDAVQRQAGYARHRGIDRTWSPEESRTRELP